MRLTRDTACGLQGTDTDTHTHTHTHTHFPSGNSKTWSKQPVPFPLCWMPHGHRGGSTVRGTDGRTDSTNEGCSFGQHKGHFQPVSRAPGSGTMHQGQGLLEVKSHQLKFVTLPKDAGLDFQECGLPVQTSEQLVARHSTQPFSQAFLPPKEKAVVEKRKNVSAKVTDSE